MHLLSCEHPQRVYNKYIGEYVWVSCGKCNYCKNVRSMRWTDALERERLNSRYTLFVTLTFDDKHLPLLELPCFYNFQDNKEEWLKHDVSLFSLRCEDDGICMPFKELIKDNEFNNTDLDLMFGLVRQFGGIPYFSTSVIQKFHKRLNKYFHDHVTQSFKNFRYWCVSEYGSTTFRPHAHAIYFTDNPQVANAFRNAVSVSWKQGLTDCQFVEKSACSYVSQYVNKSADLPFFYQTGALRPKYWFSKRPIIGALYRDDSNGIMSECSEDLRKIVYSSSINTCVRSSSNSTKFVVVPLDSSTQNRLFPKCVSFGQISDSLRIELYTCCIRFPRKTREGFKGFLSDVCKYMQDLYEDYVFSVKCIETEFSRFIYEFFYKRWIDDSDEVVSSAFEWLRRLYYTSRKFMRNCLIYGLSVKDYLNRIIDYYNKKELHLLFEFFHFQESYSGMSDDLVLMYPEFLWSNYNMSLNDFYNNVNMPDDVSNMIRDSAYFYGEYKKSHFKNAYLDSLKFKRTYKSLFNVLKVYFYAKKCNEAIEAFAT